MERTPEIFDKIEAYLSNSLSQEDAIIFEQEMAINIELQEEVEKHRIMHTTLADQDTLAFKEKLIRISNKIKQEDTTNTRLTNRFTVFKVAASIVILLGVGSLFWHTMYTKNQTQGLDLYSEYYKPYPTEDIIRGETNKKTKEIVKHYTSGSYDSVVHLLEKHPRLKEHEALQIYLGNSYLNTNQEEKAVKEFKNITNKGKYYEIAQWYLSLTYLKLDKSEKAKTLLKEIIQYNGAYKDKAYRLLIAMKK
ncbi:tetratricopeptide repeat protein [Aquimarina muelleri]|uniref:Tetratricopeptide repeat-containing protein n=1 Tax=Aquimarina muelleri TaxID=279356 RepID=A0A918N3T1_9FLAO|nr:hypothetical protein [Aquimarina muelleri]MCX2763946.1 hypothetical protein [Aquimarina muelleri]GGX22362.1 hypothetical protein GCM10007384_24460 [Aquimarina muelleri]